MTIQPVKATIIGGLLFLGPVTVAVIIVAKLYGFMVELATPFSAWIPLDAVGGIAIANIVALIMVLLISFVAGIVGDSVAGGRIQTFLDEKLLLIFPRYTFVKGITQGLKGDEGSSSMQPVRVTFDDYSQIAFELERNDDGLVTLFLPGSPDPWSGSVVYVQQGRVEALRANFNAVIMSLKSAGRGSAALLL